MTDDNTAISRVVLIGFSGSGKSTLARLVGERLRWETVDTDAAVERDAGMAVPRIFAELGEAAFRALERRTLAEAVRRDQVVIATGGGAVVDPAVWTADLLRRPGTLVVALDADPETMQRRLLAQQAAEGNATERPLLVGDDPVGRITALKARRQAVYDRAAITLVTDHTSLADLTDEIVGLAPADGGGARATIRLAAPSGSSSIVIGRGLAAELGQRVRQCWPAARHAWVVTDDRVGPLHADQAVNRLTDAGLTASCRQVAAGEGSKSLATAGALYDWLLTGGVERGDVVVALGGGVVGDLAGFVAATCLRGVGLVQVPTSLLAMVDSSVGGKTGINHAAGKNLIGAFYQPPLVLIDPGYLQTLPPRELTAGWAEVIKHALIQPSTPGGERADLLTFMERNAERLLALAEPATSYLIQRNVALKAATVQADERESGLRALLNFGHTLGHAIEAAGYHYLHGEAIALGMRAAMRLGVAMGTCDAALVERVDALLDRFGLPRQAAVDQERVLALIAHDKKRVAGRQRWVVPLANGGVAIRDDVAEQAVQSALASVTAPPA